jgi:hypothetical protein
LFHIPSSNTIQSVDLGASGFKISNSSSSDHFTITGTTWEAQANSNAASKGNFPVGFAITGTTSVGSSTWAGNTNAGVYINGDGTKLVLRLTGTFMASGGTVREYVLTPAN